jgi:NADH-quinone oxidoreductase subunit J
MSGAVPAAEAFTAIWSPVVAQTTALWWTPASGRLLTAIALGAVGICVMLQRGSRFRWGGAGLALIALLILASQVQPFSGFGLAAGFWCLAGLTILAAVATIVSSNPVHCAIWFALSLLGTGSLFMLQGAQFLAVATVAVYAGAIVVTFLFVLMLAQPGGQAFYDRIDWGVVPTFLAALAGAVVVGAITLAVSTMPRTRPLDEGPGVASDVASGLPVRPVEAPEGQHVAALGGQLFARHLVAIEVAGILLLVALVGAVAIVIQGRDSPEPTGEARHE